MLRCHQNSRLYIILDRISLWQYKYLCLQRNSLCWIYRHMLRLFNNNCWWMLIKIIKMHWRNINKWSFLSMCINKCYMFSLNIIRHLQLEIIRRWKNMLLLRISLCCIWYDKMFNKNSCRSMYWKMCLGQQCMCCLNLRWNYKHK